MGTTIGGVKYGVEHDPRGHIEAYACADPDETDEVDPCLDVADTFIEWNARGLAAKVTAGESGTDETPKARDSFRYGPDGARHFKKSEWTVGSGAAATMYTSRKYYAGAYEKTVTAGGDTVERVRIGESVVHVKTTPAGMPAGQKSVFEYAHRDHLGSLESVTDAAGKELVVLAHDPYGERRKPDWTGRLTAEEIEALLGAQGERVSRGFTGHEHLDRTGLIHMNGRMYDPRLGRFLSPDPIVGDPTSSQSWNLYSYTRNNPLSYVDPTGETELEVLVVTGIRCDWVCGEDMHYWMEWWYASNGSWIHYDSSYGYSYSDDVTRSIVEQALAALNALDQSVADQPMDADAALVPGTVQVSKFADKIGGGHYYRIRGVICERSERCDDAWADKVFDFVNRNDIPFTFDDTRKGVRNLLWSAPIYHDERHEERWSRNDTLDGHPFHPGKAGHYIHFAKNHLIYDVIGTGTADRPSLINAIGIAIFRPGVEDVVHQFGSPPTVRWYPRNWQIYP